MTHNLGHALYVLRRNIRGIEINNASDTTHRF
jgi:hypothetical protein